MLKQSVQLLSLEDCMTIQYLVHVLDVASARPFQALGVARHQLSLTPEKPPRLLMAI